MDYDELLDRFKSKDELREPMMQAHLDGDIVVATDGHVLITVPMSKLKRTYAPVPQYPNWKSILPSSSLPLEEWVTIKTAELRDKYNQIPMVDVTEDCETCDGHGEIMTLDYDTRECPTCKGIGECKATPPQQEKDMCWSVKINQTHFMPHVLERLLVAADVANATEIVFDVFGVTTLARTMFDDVAVLIMPMRYDATSPTCKGDIEVFPIQSEKPNV